MSCRVVFVWCDNNEPSVIIAPSTHPIDTLPPLKKIALPNFLAVLVNETCELHDVTTGIIEVYPVFAFFIIDNAAWVARASKYPIIHFLVGCAPCAKLDNSIVHLCCLSLVLSVVIVVGCSTPARACVCGARCADVRCRMGRQDQHDTMRPGLHVLYRALAVVLALSGHPV